ncbi:hypothetical protein SAMN05421741_101105 [Paenimyroides ummariense]|uniref:Uncharacterized protein n=1 Tax=Paenimyroides ummariense TaxID=913024 RepID=A0A1I4W754_9FLAO|nr:hypothetical protein [Paenimyroides ummariense]SFN09554.1 hypothetical protein SAMN05421741_101105 [Paenimyroides ummariense]
MELDIFNKFLTDFSALKTVTELKEKQEAFFLDLTYIVNKSIIEGEYLNIIDITDGYYIWFEILSLNSQEFTHISGAKYKDIEDFLHSLKYLISLYSLFSKKICKLYNRGVLEYIDTEIYISSENLIYKEFNSFFELTENNIELSKIDHQFINDESLLKELFKVKNNITNIRISTSQFNRNSSLHSSFTNLKDALILKVNFLIDKWYIRSSTKLKDTEFKFEEFKNIAKYNLPKNNNLNKYKDKIKYLYELDGYSYSNLLENKFNDIDKTNKKKLTFFELHTLVKYYKDKVNNLDKLNEVLRAFSNKLENFKSINIYEKFSYNISYQYCLNNYFSLFCEDFYNNCNDLNEKNLNTKLNILYKKYKDVKAKSISLTDNFFIQYKLLSYSFLTIEKVLNNAGDKTIEALNSSSNHFNIILTEVLEEYENKIQWSLKNNNYIFKLPYDESLIAYKNLNIYIASSFLLPKVNEDIINEKRLLLNHHQKLSVFFNIENQIDEIKKLKENFELDNKKLIETVTIFTAIISFIVGSIGAYKFLTTFTEALIFIIVFGISISIFVLLIFISTKGIEALKKYKLALISVYALAFIILTALIPFNYHSSEYIENSNKSRDSLHNAQERKIENLEKLILLNKSSQD